MSSFTPPAPLNPLTKARSVDINNLSDAVATAFAALPSDADLNNGTVNFGTDSGTANTYVVTLPRTPTGYVDGLRVVFTPLFSNTGASTVNVNGLGVKAIRLQDNTATEPGTLVAGIPKTLIYGAALGNFFVEANSVTSAMTAAAAAAASAGAAAGSASAAATSESNAATSASNAQAFAVAAQGTQIVATSTSSNTIGVGTLSFTIPAAKQFLPNVPIIAVDQANPTNYVAGTIASYSGTTLQIAVTDIGGSGTIAAWNISLIGTKGLQGPIGNLSGGNLTGALNDAKAADVASATTPDIWGGTGNYEVVTGTATITGFTNAPQAGARRRILAGGAFSITASANMVVKGVLSGQSYTVAAGDEIDVYAETTTKFRITIIKGDGTAMAALYGSFQNTSLLTGTGTFTAKKTGWHRITLTGGSARGGFAIGNGCRATGASGAGFCVGMRFLIAGQSYSYSQGASAADTSLTNAGGIVSGTNGSASTFFGSGIAAMTANGGVGGVASIGSTTTLNGPSGGTSTGGDINVQGGKAGDVSGTNPSGSAATGGGSVGIKGIAFASGDAIANSSVSVASGGAGIGGNSGTATGTSADTSTGGGGCEGASSASTNSTSSQGGVNYAGIASGAAQSTLSNFINTLMNATAGGLPAQATAASGDRSGGGAGGQTATFSTGDVSGTFAGGPAVAHRGDFNVPLINTRGGLYGGGTGGVALLANSQTITMRGGNPGLVQVEY